MQTTPKRYRLVNAKVYSELAPSLTESYKKHSSDSQTVYLLLASHLHETEHMVLFEQRESQELSQDSMMESRSSDAGESRSR